MGEHARPGMSLARRLGAFGLALATLALLLGGVRLIGRGGAATTTTVVPTLAEAAPTTTATMSTTTTVPPPVTHPYRGEAVIGIGSEPLTLNPFLDGGNADVVRLIGRTVWSGAFALDGQKLDPVPVLVSEIPTVDNGGLVVDPAGPVTVTYRVNPEAVWEDGNPVTGEDFAFTFQLVTDPSLPIRPDVREPYRQIVPGSLIATEDTVTLDLIGPSLAYLDLFSVVVPAHQVADSDFATDWNDSMWASAGPFSFGNWQPGRQIVLDRNERYWARDPETGQSLPYLDRLVFAVETNQEAVTAGLTSGRFDVVALPPDAEVVQNLQSLAGLDVQVGWGPTWEHLSFQFGPGRFDRNPSSLNEHLEFRKAVAFAVDREAVVEAAYGGLVPVLDSPVGIAWPSGESPGWSVYRPDSDRASQLLTELEQATGVTNPIAVLTTNLTPERTAALGALARTFADAAIDLDIEPPEETGVFFLETVGPGSFDLAEWAWVPGSGPSAAVADLRRWYVDLPEQGGSNFSRWGSGSSAVQGEEVERLAELFDEIAVELDLDRLRRLLTEVEELMADLVVTIPLYPELNAGAVWATDIAGYSHSVLPGGDTWNAAFWYRAEG